MRGKTATCFFPYTTVANNGIDEKACKLGFTLQCLSEHLVKCKVGIYLKLYSMT